MKCDKARDLILTEYIDGEISGKLKQELEDHLLQCISCRELLVLSKTKVEDVFDNAQVQETPEYVWHRIKDKIVHQNIGVHKITLTGFITGLFKAPKLQLALAALIFMIMTTITFKIMGNPDDQVAKIIKNNPDNTETTYIAFLMGYEESDEGQSTTGYGTYIEEYFL
jgi:hypothetical protein